MFTKPQRTNVFKLGSLALLLVVFGFVGSHAFAGISTTCGGTQAFFSSEEWTGHSWTCEADSPTNQTCGTTDNRQSCRTPRAGDSCAMKCCLCDKPLEALGNGFQGFNTQPPASPDKINLPTPQELCKAQGSNFQWQNGSCVNCSDPNVCCGVKLNTNVPFIGNCIRTGTDGATTDGTTVTETTAFPRLMGGLTKIMTTIILLVCFGGILVGGVMVASSGGETQRATDGKKLIGKVIIAMALLGTSGIILHLINPNFFG